MLLIQNFLFPICLLPGLCYILFNSGLHYILFNSVETRRVPNSSHNPEKSVSGVVDMEKFLQLQKVPIMNAAILFEAMISVSQSYFFTSSDFRLFEVTAFNGSHAFALGKVLLHENTCQLSIKVVNMKLI